MTPLDPGEPLTRWTLGATEETRYDVADQPMAGEMDAGFFLTRTRNFIPHEYPCRTHFAAAHRDRRPEPAGAFAPTRNWLPFGSPRVDLSGFWFRATRLGTWARTKVSSPGGAATFRLTTCGGAILFADGRDAGWLAPYTRNLEAARDVVIDLPAGACDLDVWFDDLAERDARYWFRLDFVGGVPVTPQNPFAATHETVAAVEATLSPMHFAKPWFDGEDVVIALPIPLPAAASAQITIEGDFISYDRLTRDRPVPAGATALSLGPSDDLPADFRQVRVALTLGGFTAARTLGVEITHAARQGTPPDTLAARIAEALEIAATTGEAGPVTALARLATGRSGAQTDAMLASALGPIAECWDCADFALVPLLWARMRYADAIGADTRVRIDETILGYRYWLDEPGNDVQWFFSENHALLFHTAATLAGALLPEATFTRSGRTGAQQSAVGLARVRAWLDHFERWEMAEFNSAPYFPIDFKGLAALHVLAPDAEVAARATAAIARLVEIVANSAHHGVLTAAQGRSYEHSLRAAQSSELSAIGRLLWGHGSVGARLHALPLLALAMRDHGLALPDLTGRAFFEQAGEQEWTFAQGEGRFAALYHAKTRDWALGTAARYRWGEWGYQETLIHARIGRAPQAQVFINHPGEVIHGGYGRPSYWGGSASVPRVHQYRGLAVVLFAGTDEQPDFTHAFFPEAAFDAAAVDGNVAAATSGGGAMILVGSAPLERVTSGPTAGCELRLPGRDGRWIVRVTTAAAPAEAAARFAGLTLEVGPDDTITIADPDYGPVRFGADGVVEAEGRRLDPATWTIAGHRSVF